MNKLVNDNLYETRSNLVKEITLLSDAQFNHKPDMSQWSIAQVCHHLVLVEPNVEPFEVQQILDLLNDSRNKLMTFLSTIEDKSNRVNQP